MIRFRFISLPVVVIMLFGWAMLVSGVEPQDSTVTEVPSDTTIAYINVDVVVHFDWTDPESYKAVNLMVLYEGTTPKKFSIIEVDRGYIGNTGRSFVSGKRQLCEYDLSKGMRIEVYEHESGRLIKTFSYQELNI